MNGEVTEIHKTVYVRKGYLEAGCEDFEPKKLEDWGGLLVGDPYYHLDI